MTYVRKSGVGKLRDLVACELTRFRNRNGEIVRVGEEVYLDQIPFLLLLDGDKPRSKTSGTKSSS
jgi:hypothetical protein